jgi:hypothetical protein
MDEKYVLFNPNEAKSDVDWGSECYGFWSNSLGYTSLTLATIYTKYEVNEPKFIQDASVMGCIIVGLPKWV